MYRLRASVSFPSVIVVVALTTVFILSSCASEKVTSSDPNTNATPEAIALKSSSVTPR